MQVFFSSQRLVPQKRILMHSSHLDLIEEAKEIIGKGFGLSNRKRLEALHSAFFPNEPLCQTCPSRHEDAFYLIRSYLKSQHIMSDQTSLKKYKIKNAFRKILWKGNVYTAENITDESVDEFSAQIRDLYFEAVPDPDKTVLGPVAKAVKTEEK